MSANQATVVRRLPNGRDEVFPANSLPAGSRRSGDRGATCDAARGAGRRAAACAV